MPVSITFNQPALRSLAIAASDKDLRVRANRVLNEARRRAPVDTGRLRGSLSMVFSVGPHGEPVARIGSNLPYAIYVHEGTGIYGPKHSLIYPVKGKFMRWPAVNNSGTGNRRYKGGKTQLYIFAKSTKGMPGRPFLLQALDAAKGP